MSALSVINRVLYQRFRYRRCFEVSIISRCTTVLSVEVCIVVLLACGDNRIRFALRVLSLESLIAVELACAAVSVCVASVNGNCSCHSDICTRMMFSAPWQVDTVVHAPSAGCVIARRLFM